MERSCLHAASSQHPVDHGRGAQVCLHGLQHVWMLAGAPPEVLTALLANLQLKVYAPGDWLFDRARGDHCDVLTLVVEGRVRLAHDVVPVVSHGSDRREASYPMRRRIVSTLRAGQFFGETSLLRCGPLCACFSDGCHLEQHARSPVHPAQAARLDLCES
jgi:hypothetical protein